MRVLLALLLLLPLAGCELVFKLPTRQGNAIEQKDLDKLKVGMSREQVRFIMGTPIATSAFRNDRWDYYGYYKPPRGQPYSRTVSLFFEGDTLARMEGEQPVKGAATPDVETIEQEQLKAAAEKERAKEEKKTEGILAPPDQQEHQDGGGGGAGGGK